MRPPLSERIVYDIVAGADIVMRRISFRSASSAFASAVKSGATTAAKFDFINSFAALSSTTALNPATALSKNAFLQPNIFRNDSAEFEPSAALIGIPCFDEHVNTDSAAGVKRISVSVPLPLRSVTVGGFFNNTEKLLRLSHTASILTQRLYKSSPP